MIVQPTAKNYFVAFLQGLGLPVTDQNLRALYGVATLEGWNNRYNPLNVIQPEPGSAAFNSVGVQSYADFDSGVKGAVTLFEGSHWDGVRAALAKGNDGQGVLAAFKAAYTWDPGVQFSMGSLSDGNIKIGGAPGDGQTPTGSYNPGSGASTDSAGAGGGGSQKPNYRAVDGLGDLLTSVPELNKLLQQAQANDWSTQRFLNAVENSDWYQNHSATARAEIIQRANDPASWQSSLRATTFSIMSLEHQLGMSLTPDENHAIAVHALLSGNSGNQQWLTDRISHHEDYSNLKNLNNLQGQMAGTTAQLQQLAADYGVRWTPAQFAQHAQDIVDGTTTIDTFQRRMVDWAMSAFPGWSKQLQEGRTLAQVADPYVQSMSQILEMNPSQLDTYTPMIRQALQGSRDKSGDWNPTSLIDFERQLRSDPRYWKTQGAVDTVSSALIKMGQDFGFGPEG